MMTMKMTNTNRSRWCGALTRSAVCLYAAWATGCSDTDDSPKEDDKGAAAARRAGSFVAPAVSGLDYSTPTGSGKTDDEGRFTHGDGEIVTFAIGELTLGSALGRDKLTARDLVAGANDVAQPRVNNLLVLLQTLDQDGDLNNGIRITPEIAAIVSKHKTLNLDQLSAKLAEDAEVVALLRELNEANVFTDTDPRPRRLRGSTAAAELFTRASAERRVVATQHGPLSGYAANASTWQWLGVPYARPPLGELRWKPPAEPLAWTKARDAVAWSDQAPQDPRFEASGEGGMSEDCLYLNVTAPRDAQNLPVMVWFHGGAFTILTANSRSYNNVEALTTKGVVLVTVNHRLGPFGYINHPLLVADSSYGGSGNYGQMDLVRSLQWVKQNIANFGGDPNNVTIFGQSGGCGKVSSLMISPQAKGLFHKAACQSGTTAISSEATVQSSIASAEEVGKALFARIGASTVQQARALPWTAIVQADMAAMIPREIYRPAVDNYYLSKTFYQSIRDGQESDVPLLIGATNGDYATLRSGLRDVMPLRAQYSKAPLYVYKFSRAPAGWAPRGILAGHGGELPYLFNHAPMFVNNYLFDLVLDPATGKRPEIGDTNGNGVTGTAGDAADVLASLAWNDGDSQYAQTTMTVWTNFAKTGNPSTAELQWPPYTQASDVYVEFGASAVEVKTGLAAAFP